MDISHSLRLIKELFVSFCLKILTTCQPCDLPREFIIPDCFLVHVTECVDDKVPMKLSSKGLPCWFLWPPQGEE